MLLSSVHLHLLYLLFNQTCSSLQVILYSATASGWDKTASLDQHDLRVTGIDWAPKTNRAVRYKAGGTRR